MTKDGSWLTSLSSQLPDLFDRLPFPIAIVEDDGHIAFANREFKDVFPGQCPAARSLPFEVETAKRGTYELHAISVQGMKAVVGRDVSELVASRRQLAKMEKFASFGQIVSGVSEELAAVLDIGDATGASEIVRRFLRPIDGSSKSLSLCDMNVSIQSVLRMKAAAHNAADVHVTQDLQNDLPSVLIDGSQLQQMLLCLLLNAEQNSVRTSTGSKQIHVRSIMHDGNVRVLVTSSPESAAPDQSGSFNLELCAEIVSEYGGRLCVWRNAEAQSTIMLQLPATKTADDSVGSMRVNRTDGTNVVCNVISSAVD